MRRYNALYLVSRLLAIVPMMLIICIVVFLLLELAPGDSSRLYMDTALSEEELEEVKRELGLDKSVVVRLLQYVSRLVRGDLGRSVRSGLSVTNEIAVRVRYTVVLMLGAILLGSVIGLTIGTGAATTKRSGIDFTITGSVSVLTAAPTYWIALLLVSLLSVRLRILPVLGVGTLRHAILPIFCASLSLVPGIARLTRASLLESYRSEYVRNALARGISNRLILLRHLRSPVAITVVNYIGTQSIRLVTTLAVLETVFSRPGLGSLVIRAALDQDAPVILGASLFIALLTFCVFFIVDVTVHFLDPRLRDG